MSNLILHGGPIIDVQSGSVLRDHFVAIDGERIAGVAPIGELPTESRARRIDVGGRTILPGLIDAHTHLMSRSGVEADPDLITTSTIDGVITARRIIDAGITTVRDPGTKHRGIHALKREIALGRIGGPRTFAAGPNIVGSAAPADWRNAFVDGVDSVRKVVRQERLAGADFIKLVLSHTTGSSRWRTCIRYLNDEEIAAAVAEAHLLDARTGCHCEGLPAARAAVSAGMDVIDHGLALDDALVKEMAERGTFYVPTLWAFSTDTHLNYVGTIGEHQQADFEERIGRVHRESVQRAMAEGVLIGAGSDPIHWVPARDVLVREIEALVERAGMSHADALRAATINGATIIGIEDEVGTLTAGKYADVIVVDGNPLQDVRSLARPALVVKEGEIMLDLLGDPAAANAHWLAMASGEPGSDRQPEIWLERK